MGKRATGTESKPRELIPARTYLGVLVGIYDIGTQPGYQGGKREPKFIFNWELHLRGNRKRGPEPARDSDGEVLTISQFLTFKLGTREWPSTMLGVIEAIEGRPLTDEEIKSGVDVEEQLEGVAQIIVKHDGIGDEARAKVDSVAGLDPDEDEPEPVSDTVYFELEDDRIRSGQIPTDVPEWIHKFIKSSVEWESVHGKYVDDKGKGRGNNRPQPAPVGPPPSDDDDDIPY